MTDKNRPGTTGRRQVTRVRRGNIASAVDTLVTEEPVELRLAWPGQPPVQVAVVMRTPGHDFELACGFLLSEGVLRPADVPATVAYCLDPALGPEQEYNVVTVTLETAPRRLPGARSTAVSSACGVCGMQSLDEVFAADAEPLSVDTAVPAEALADMLHRMRSVQPLFDRTGATHAAGVFSNDGRLVLVREDVGRHNAVDKVLGARVLGSADYDETAVLCVSGRVGFDIISKAVAGRIGIVAAVGGASSLAVDLAARANVTLCGFVRPDSVVVYTVPTRVTSRSAEVAVP